MQWIDQNTWPRAEHFALFSGVSNPFYSTTFRVDVTNLYDYTKSRGISFYYSLTYLVTHAINQVENFRYVLEEVKVGLLERRIPSFTDMKKGSNLFHIVTMACEGTMEEFCRAAGEKSMAQTGLLDQSAETNQLIYISCLPWVDLTGCTNERDLDPDDTIPRITWGKFVSDGERKTLGMSVEVNHRLVDGIHIGLFYQYLQKAIDQLH